MVAGGRVRSGIEMSFVDSVSWVCCRMQQRSVALESDCLTHNRHVLAGIVYSLDRSLLISSFTQTLCFPSVQFLGSLRPVVPAGLPSRGGDVTVYVLDINQPSVPTFFILFLCLFLSL